MGRPLASALVDSILRNGGSVLYPGRQSRASRDDSTLSSYDDESNVESTFSEDLWLNVVMTETSIENDTRLVDNLSKCNGNIFLDGRETGGRTIEQVLSTIGGNFNR